MGNHYYRGEYTQVVQRCEQVRGLRDKQRGLSWAGLYGLDHGVASIAFEAMAYAPLGYVDRARQRSLEAVHEAETLGHPFTLSYVLGYAATTLATILDWESCQARSEEAIALGTTMGFPVAVGVGKINSGGARAQASKDPAGLDLMREGLADLMKSGVGGVGTPSALAGLSNALLALDHVEEALGTAESGLAHSRERGNCVSDAELHRIRGECLLLLDRVEEAEASLRRSLEVAASQEAKLFEIRSAVVLARHWHDQGRTDEARDLLAPIYDWFTEGFDTRDLIEAKSLLEELGG
jgi:tetratricopeptide (TPR) repeat protein